MKAHTGRALLAIVCTILTLTTSAETGTTFSMIDPDIVKALATLNKYRTNAGLKPVKLNEELSRGCFAHSRYVVKNKSNPATAGLSGHYEIDSLPYATIQGKKAGRSSCIAYVNPQYAIDQFMNTFYHRMPLIDPNTTEVGIGYYKEDYYTVCCVDMRGEWKWNNDTATKVVVYPEPDALDITTGFQNELPNPLPDTVDDAGYPITIQFFRDYGGSIRNVKAKLTDKEGRVVLCILSTPEHPLTSFPQNNIVCIIPVNRLQYSKTYTVDFSCMVGGKPFRKKWSFYTRIGWAD